MFKGNSIVVIALICSLSFVTLPALSDNVKPATISFDTQLTKLEKEVFGKKFAEESFIQRIDRLEIKLIGQKQSGLIVERIQNLDQIVKNQNNKIYVLTNTTEAPNPKKTKKVPGLIEELPPGKTYEDLNKEENEISDLDDKTKVSNNSKSKKEEKEAEEVEEAPQFDPEALDYYDTLMYVNKNKVIRFKKMPIKVFLPSGTNITYRNEYRKAVIRAMNIWKIRSNGKIDYVLVDNPKKADIIVLWQENFPESQETAGETSITSGYNIKQSATGNFIGTSSMFMPGYYGYAASLLGALVGGIGNDRPKIRDVKLRIGTLPAMRLNKDQSMNLIQSIASHEFGHSIGLNSHSVNPEDVMHYNIPFDGLMEKMPQQRDINTAVELYQKSPDITD